MTDYHSLYDKTKPESIENYAKKLIGKTYRDILQEDVSNIVQETTASSGQPLSYYESTAAKGSHGHLLEEHYFHYDINSDSNPDFKEAGVELKVTPYKKNKNGSYSAKERLVITIIDYMTVIAEPFENSHLKKKCNLILLIYHEYIKNLDKLNYMINYVQLFQLPKEDLAIIKRDYEKIIDKINAGKAHELSEGDTYYLGACTKGATAASSLRQQPYSNEKAKQRAFCFKTAYMTYVLNNYIIPGKETYEKLQYHGDFGEYVLSSINTKTNHTVADLINEYLIHYERRPKNLESTLVFRILGLKSNRAEEFVKAGIVVKTIRLEPNETLRETVSFPAFDFIELAEETWEEAEINSYLSETKFLFVVFKKDSEYESFRKKKDFSGMDKHLSLYFTTFWNMPKADIEGDVKAVWKRTRRILSEGIKTAQHGTRTYNNLPAMSENRVCHIRPHGKDKTDVLPLPTGGAFMKQSFFLNASYIHNQIMKQKEKRGN